LKNLIRGFQARLAYISKLRLKELRYKKPTHLIMVDQANNPKRMGLKSSNVELKNGRMVFGNSIKVVKKNIKNCVKKKARVLKRQKKTNLFCLKSLLLTMILISTFTTRKALNLFLKLFHKTLITKAKLENTSLIM
jgi:hypothetical protein